MQVFTSSEQFVQVSLGAEISPKVKMFKNQKLKVLFIKQLLLSKLATLSSSHWHFPFSHTEFSIMQSLSVLHDSSNLLSPALLGWMQNLDPSHSQYWSEQVKFLVSKPAQSESSLQGVNATVQM